MFFFHSFFFFQHMLWHCFVVISITFNKSFSSPVQLQTTQKCLSSVFLISTLDLTWFCSKSQRPLVSFYDLTLIFTWLPLLLYFTFLMGNGESENDGLRASLLPHREFIAHLSSEKFYCISPPLNNKREETIINPLETRSFPYTKTEKSYRNHRRK